MDKNAIKKYAVWARRELISRVSQRAAFYGITEDDHGDASADSVLGRVLSADEKSQRQALIARIREKGYEQVMEEVAYTWFNRFAALRFMEVNGYLPTRIRVFTDEENHFRPQLLAEAINLELDGLNMEKVYAMKSANQDEQLFKYLLIVQCNALNSILPGMFQRINDYTELLLPDYLLREGSVIEQMVTTIPEEDWTDQVQIIGWLYQYYNTEPKDRVFANLKKNIKISKENIPAATQLFTPDWIVHYMVENSLGRLWVEGHPAAKEKYLPAHNEDGSVHVEDGKWNYYLEEAKQEPEVEAQLAEIRKEYAALKPEEIRVIDPCCGSGHILVVMFDVLVQIYEDYGYTAREAASGIVKNNLWGLDIDERAAQLSYFAVMMKARQNDRRFFSRHLQPHVYAIEESNDVSQEVVDYFCKGDAELKKAMRTILTELHDAKEYGSILTCSAQDWDALYERFSEVYDDISLYRDEALALLPIVQTAEALSQQYDVVVTNPPYMAVTNADSKLYDFISNLYPKAKTDLFSAFIERCGLFAKAKKYYSMITQQSWLSLSSFLELRKEIFAKDMAVSMAQIGSKGFDEISGEVVSSVAFIMRQGNIPSYRGTYSDLQSGDSEAEKEQVYLSRKYYYEAAQDGFNLIPNNVVVYNASDIALRHFEDDMPLSALVTAKPGMQTSDNDRFLRLWFEVRFTCIGFGFNHDMASSSEYKWFPYNKGIGFRKWYGNNDYIVNFYHDGEELKYWLTHNPKDPKTSHWSRNMRNYNSYFEDGITFTAIGAAFSARLNGKGYLFDTKGPMMFGKDLLAVCGFVNSVVFDYYNRMLCKQITKTFDSVNLVPFAALDERNHKRILHIVTGNLELSKSDWDSFETSWDFQRHPLVALKGGAGYATTPMEQWPSTLRQAYQSWEADAKARFDQLKANEEELNRIFIDIYGLQDELTPEVEDKDVTVRKADLRRDIKSLISYAVGCMFGRYSLDKPGLVYAGGDFEDVYRKDVLVDENGERITIGGFGLSVSKGYTQVNCDGTWVDTRFGPDRDNILPICDDEYFEDDIVGRFVKFMEVVYGKDTLEENLRFIADALGGKGSSREVIRNYFLNDFYADHLKIYQKRPIYWLFDSGKKNGFKCLIYMHRYQPDTIARIRTDYVHEQQSRYRTAMADLESRMDGAATAERVRLSKQLTKLKDQAEELRVYEEKIHHLADQMIPIDLDDGVKVNYAKFQDVLAKIK